MHIHRLSRRSAGWYNVLPCGRRHVVPSRPGCMFSALPISGPTLRPLVSFVMRPSTGRPHCASPSLRPSKVRSSQERKIAATSNLLCGNVHATCRIISGPDGQRWRSLGLTMLRHEWYHDLRTVCVRSLNLMTTLYPHRYPTKSHMKNVNLYGKRSRPEGHHRDGTGSPGHGSVCQTRCLTRFWGLTCAFIVALCLQSNTISAN